MFDPDLADMLIGMPDEVFQASKRAIKGIDPFMKDADLDIRFRNVSNEVPLKDLTSFRMGEFVKVRGIVSKVEKPFVRMDIALFECRGCMRLHEVEQQSNTKIMEPSICSECGGRSFRLLQNQSKFEDIQHAILREILNDESSRAEPIEILIVLEGDLIRELRKKDIVDLTGTLRTFRKGNGFINYLYVNNIEFIYKWGIDLEDK